MAPNPAQPLPAPGRVVPRWLPSFRDPDVEERYRQAFLPEDRLVVMAPLFMFTVANALFAASDLDFTGGGAPFTRLLLIRGGVFAMSLLVLVVLWRARSTLLIDGTLFAWVLFTCALSLSLVETRPPDYAPRVLMDGFFVLVIFLLIPNRFILQCIPAWILTAGSLWSVFFEMSLDPASMRSVLVVFIFANVFGGWTAWRWHIDRRERFAQLLEERRLRTALEQQRERGQMLEGLLPICSTCKSIRDDEGYWRKVEQYLSDRTDAVLTHGICPDCEAEAYSDLGSPPA